MSDNRPQDDCCDTDVPQPQYTSPPGQPYLTYRTGTYSASLARMLARISTETIPNGENSGARPLADLRTRDFSDPSVALISAWAVGVDVMSFYMERFANEGYLRTLTERVSALKLARMIGYELNPGVAASTYLAFTVDSGSTSPGEAVIPAGTPVKSIPPQGDLPQTFETSHEFTGYAAWNNLRPRLTYPQTFAIYGGKLYLLDSDDLFEGVVLDIADLYLCDDVTFEEGRTTVNAVEMAEVFITGTSSGIKAGQVILLAGKRQDDDSYTTFIKPVLKVEKQPELERTRLVLDVVAAPPSFSLIATQVAYTLTAVTSSSFSGSSVQTNIASNTISNTVLNSMIVVNNWVSVAVLNYINQPKSIAPLSDNQGAFVFNDQMAFFGAGAPAWNSLPYNQREANWVLDTPATDGDDPVYKKEDSVPFDDNWDEEGWEIWKSYDPNAYYSPTYGYSADVYLERDTEDISRNDWVVFEDTTAASKQDSFHAYRVASVRNGSITGFSLSGKSTGLTLADETGDALAYNTADRPTALKVRSTTAHIDSERLALAEMPILDPLESVTVVDDALVYAGASKIMLNQLVTGLQVDQAIAVSGEQADAEGVTQQEIAIIYAVDHVRGYTVLTLKNSLQYRYIRETVTINANVVPATHGETVNEILGSGDSAQVNQTFTLKKPPLTYVSAQTERGSESTMTVRVNNIEWEEESALYGLPANVEAYIIRLEDNGKDGIVRLIFGDGKQGARLPTGQNNITATYRTGIGEGGEVAADSLSILQRKPLYVRGVTNPTAASGSESPESIENARQNAPLNVLTLGRIVSLQDFEDFARAFAGVGKAAVRVLWTGENDLVHITIASATGNPVEAASELYTNLTAAIDRVRDPIQEVRVDTFALHLFNVKAAVLVDDRYVAADVLAEVEIALIDHFSFEQRQFGQAARAADVISAMQQVSGVIAVDLDQLYDATDSSGPAQTLPPPILPALPARWSSTGQLLLAELLLINTFGIDLREMSS